MTGITHVTKNTHTTENSQTQMEIHTHTLTQATQQIFLIDKDVYWFYIMIAYFLYDDSATIP